MNQEENTVKTVIVQKETNSAATTSLVLGIIGVIVGFIPYVGWFMVPVWLLAIIFGFIGMRKKYRRGMSITGLILGLLGAIYKIGFWLVAAGGLLTLATSGNETTSLVETSETVSQVEDTQTTEIQKDVEIPFLEGTDLESAKSELEANGFIVGDIIETADESIPEGFVIKTEPKANRLAKPDTEVTIYQSSGPPETLIVQDMDTGEEIEVIQGRTDQKFLFIYFSYRKPDPENPKAMDVLSENMNKLKEAEIEVIGLIDPTTSYEEKQYMKNRNWDFPIYLDKDNQYYKKHSIFFTPDISIQDGAGNIITELSGQDFFFESIETDDGMINEILDKVKING